MNPADSSFIYSTWLKSYRQMPYAQNMSNDVFFFHHKQVVEKILSKPNTVVTVMCESSDPNHIYGYSVVEHCESTSILHYVYMKHAYRKMGITKGLLLATCPNFGQQLTFVTHESRHHKAFKDKFNLEFNPYLI